MGGDDEQQPLPSGMPPWPLSGPMSMAIAMHETYTAFLEVGFNAEQAFALTLKFQEATFAASLR